MSESREHGRAGEREGGSEACERQIDGSALAEWLGAGEGAEDTVEEGVGLEGSETESERLLCFTQPSVTRTKLMNEARLYMRYKVGFMEGKRL